MSCPAQSLIHCADGDRKALIRACTEIDIPPIANRFRFVSLADPGVADTIRTLVLSGDVVIGLASRAQTRARKMALAAGASEFLTTGPIVPEDLRSRLQYLSDGASVPDDFSLDEAESILSIRDKSHELGGIELPLVATLLAAKGGFVTHETLLTRLWGPHADDPQKLRVAVRRLREAIEPEPDMPRYILSEPAIGYRLGSGRAMNPASHL